MEIKLPFDTIDDCTIISGLGSYKSYIPLSEIENQMIKIDYFTALTNDIKIRVVTSTDTDFDGSYLQIRAYSNVYMH